MTGGFLTVGGAAWARSTTDEDKRIGKAPRRKMIVFIIQIYGPFYWGLFATNVFNTCSRYSSVGLRVLHRMV